MARIRATIPTAAHPARYGDKSLLDLTAVSLNNGAIAARADDGVEVYAYLGDASGNARISAPDGTLVARAVLGTDSGFWAYANADPLLLADATADGRLTSLDTARVNQEANFYLTGNMTYNRAELPDIALAMVMEVIPSGPDPRVSLPPSLAATVGERLTVPVELDLAEGLHSVQLQLAYDPGVLKLEAIRRGSLTGAFDTWLTAAQDGVIRLDAAASNALGAGAGTLVLLDFRVIGAGAGLIDLQSASLNDGALVLSPAPHAGVDATDAVLSLAAARAGGRPSLVSVPSQPCSGFSK